MFAPGAPPTVQARSARFESMNVQKEQCLFFLSLPNLRELCRVFLSFPNCSDEGELRNKQLYTCREILHLHPDVIASPVLGSYGGINVIMAITFLKRGFIQVYAQKHGLQLGAPQRVLPDHLQTSVSYSITARLAPNWNRVGQYLIAVMELNANETELCVSVEVNTVRLPPATLEDFNVPSRVMKTFLNNREAVIDTLMPNNWCYILPSMKKGQVISISRKIPKECPFRSYSELRNHWKSMYGYYLPPLNEDEVVYCSMYFKLVGEKLFTYPLSCIRIQPVQLFPRVDLQGALGAFMSDLRILLENICGFSVQVTNKPLYHTNKLSRPISQVSNLTTNKSSRLVLTQITSSYAPRSVPLSQLASSKWPLTQPGHRSNTSQKTTTKELVNMHNLGPCLVSSDSPVTSIPPFSSSSCLSLSCLSSTQPQHESKGPKLVPIFKNKSIVRHVNITKILAKKQQKQAEAESQHMSGPAVKRPHPSSSVTPSSSYSSGTLTSSFSQPTRQRVTLPFCKNHKEKQGVSVPALHQPVSKTQPLAMPEIPSVRGGEIFESHPKKPKVTMQDMDLVKYAKSNQLAKINVATLQVWLRGQGVTVRSKDKKEELVSKVIQCLYEH
ncbi:uncharacterized protein C18orf63-like isoform X2 [Hoplias malabaricus]|uniref:uncharacterized protein C18orf63-like isoform X2 n=1 Tax=Hoplias malabaricus TaxID=27720 RepID=UPI00346234DD